MTDASLPEAARRGVWARLAGHRLAMLGLALIALTVMAALFAPVLTHLSPDEQLFDGLTLEGAPLPPTAPSFSAPTCSARDLLTRLLYGARTSLVIGVARTVPPLGIGTFVGVTAGYFRRLGRRDPDALHRPDVAFPALLLAICSRRSSALALDRRPRHRDGELGPDGARATTPTDRPRSPNASSSRRKRALGPGTGAILFPPHAAAPRADHARLGHARHLHDGPPRSDPHLPRHRRAAALRRAGATSSTRTETYFVRAVARLHPRGRDPDAGALPSTSSATRSATSSIRRSGARLMAVYSPAVWCSRS